MSAKIDLPINGTRQNVLRSLVLARDPKILAAESTIKSPVVTFHQNVDNITEIPSVESKVTRTEFVSESFTTTIS